MTNPLTLQPLSFVNPPVYRHTRTDARADDTDTSRCQLLVVTVMPQSSLPDSIERHDAGVVPPIAAAKFLLT
jgi:hypothetical protein